MKILITGGNGFLGRNLVKHFLNNHELLVISQNNNNLLDILDRIEFNTKIDEQSILNFNPNIIIHCAWDGGNNYVDVTNIAQISKNIPVGIDLLHIMSKLTTNVKFIGFGSFAEYGILTTKALETDIEYPINFYGVAKNQFKTISKLYCEQHNIDWTWIRPCYIYGPDDVSTRLIPSVINKLINKHQITLNSCDTVIDYLHITDFCSAIDSIIKYNLTGIYNICSGNEYKLLDIIDFLYNSISVNETPIFDASLDRPHSSKYICGSNEKLKLNSNWDSKTSIEVGLNELIYYYKLKNK